MNVVDSSGWLSYFASDANAGHFATPIEHTEELIVPSITLAEVFKRILQQRDEDLALQAIAHMQLGRVIDLDANLAISAAQIGATLKLPLADSIIYATAKHHDAILWTQDSDFKKISGVKFFPKKSGARQEFGTL